MAKKPKKELPPPPSGDNLKAVLKGFVERGVNIRGEQKELSDDMRDLYEEARGVGLDAAALRQVVNLKSMDPEKRAERQERDGTVEAYMHALGMI